MNIATVIKRYRYSANDFTTSDEVLTGNLTMSSKFVAMENSGIGSVWTLADDGEISSNPSDDYVVLTILRACSVAQQTMMRSVANRSGSESKLGPSSIATTSITPHSSRDFITAYKDASNAWKISKNVSAFRSIISPANLSVTPH